MKIINVDGTESELEDTSLSSMQKAIGGYVESIFLPVDKKYLLVDEDGSLKGLEINTKASDLAGIAICGTALIAEVWEMS